MITKYSTGDRVLIPAVITSAREVGGVIIYDVRSEEAWDGIREDAIVLDSKASALARFRETIDELNDRWR